MRKVPTSGPARKAGDEAVDEVVDDRVDEEFLHEIPDHGAEEIIVKRGRFGPTIERAKTVFSLVKKYERTLSAFGMVAGFVTDNLMFRRIDLPNTQAIFAAYLGVAAFSIVGLHFLERRAREGKHVRPLARVLSHGDAIRAGRIVERVPRLLFAQRRHHQVLALSRTADSLLHRQRGLEALSLAPRLHDHPVLLRRPSPAPSSPSPSTRTPSGKLTFLLSGAIAVGVLVLFLYLLAMVNRPQFVAARGKIALGVASVYVLMNVFYFTNTLPPLPLALAHVGVYHSVKKTGDVYQAVAEDAPWYTQFGLPPTLHVKAGQPLYAYSAVFAPIKLSTKIVHRWRRYDPKTGHWITLSTVTFPINGGRDGGYRGYTIKHNIQPGDWRVDINTIDGHLIGRVTFKVDRADTAPSHCVGDLEIK